MRKEDGQKRKKDVREEEEGMKKRLVKELRRLLEEIESGWKR